MRSILVLAPGAALELKDAPGPADALLLDLDRDGAAGREAARAAAKAFLKQARGLGPALYVKAAPAGGAALDADLAAVIPAAPAGIFLEASSGRACVQHLCAKLAVLEAESALPDGSTKIVALAAGAPRAVFGLGGYAGASPRLAGLAFDGGAMPGASRDVARALLALGAAAAGAPAIDGLDEGAGAAGFAALCAAARDGGFAAKLAADAEQARIINEVFGAGGA